MPSLSLVNIDPAVVEALRKRAAAKARSIEAEAAELLARAVISPSDGGGKWAEVKRIAEMTPKGVAQTDSVLPLRQDRDWG